MLGKLDPAQKQVTVVGAGIAGLLIAHRLDRLGYEVTLLEAGDRPGGLIQSSFNDWGLAESAAHSLLASEPVRALFERLRVPLVELQQKSRFVLRRGKLSRVPVSPLDILIAIIRAYFMLGTGSCDPEDVNLEDWSNRHLGRGFTDFLVTPFVRGIYGAEPGELTVGAAFPALAVYPNQSLLSQQIRNRTPGKKAARPMMAPRDGMGSLVSALDEALREKLGRRYRLSEPIARLPSSSNLILCTPAPEVARLLAETDDPLAAALGRIRYSPLISATVFVDRSEVPAAIHGVGVLVPAVEKRAALGILFNSNSFERRVSREDIASFTMMLGGTSRPELLELGDGELRALVASELEAILKIRSGIREIVIHRWNRAVPLYDSNLSAAWTAARDGWCAQPGRVLFGNYTGQVSLRGMIETVSTIEV